MSKPTRIVLRPELVEQAKELCHVTQSASLSELMAILISRYGRHLKDTWQVSGLCAQPSPLPGVELRGAQTAPLNLDEPIVL
ncbi:hypothetical protein H6G20_05915 [Desertifilum sp. FACHB-1129]|uniref:hypothetical protein n=1 Tax=unclassified Desertifilum TaxID=2621682 RepID=UPI0016848B10|nr:MULTISPECIES: hypothetical protein [unclassified Desertifilum]MBD2311193.1 hypothetical protein [Desertifilum sp. FACHB-1129]MBD2324362.1 hypothetical protein [Desertifilum sp. FACHB-866]MBD2334376.1 hypothetical protein [Desertifilum sp. FACHB-868]MDA0213223.1 hypothetical protein [Cyanobacteria bacterium FC1]